MDRYLKPHIFKVNSPTAFPFVKVTTIQETSDLSPTTLCPLVLRLTVSSSSGDQHVTQYKPLVEYCVSLKISKRPLYRPTYDVL